MFIALGTLAAVENLPYLLIAVWIVGVVVYGVIRRRKTGRRFRERGSLAAQAFIARCSSGERLSIPAVELTRAAFAAVAVVAPEVIRPGDGPYDDDYAEAMGPDADMGLIWEWIARQLRRRGIVIDRHETRFYDCRTAEDVAVQLTHVLETTSGTG